MHRALVPPLSADAGARVASPFGLRPHGKASRIPRATWVPAGDGLRLHARGYPESSVPEISMPPLPRPASRRNPRLALAGTTGLGIAAGLLIDPLAAVTVTGLGGSYVLRRERSQEQILRQELLSLQAKWWRIDASARPQRLESLLELDPDQDRGRLLLACAYQAHGDDLSTLMQLGPLRDRHPTAGEVLVVAATAYRNMGMPVEALRLLGAVRVAPAHPAADAVRWIRQDCREGLTPRRTAVASVASGP